MAFARPKKNWLTGLLCLPLFWLLPQQGIDPVRNRNDFFNGNQLDPSWQVLNPHLVTLQVSDGELHLTPTAAGGAASWFADGEGPLVYKEVTGDFTVTAKLRAYDSNNPNLPPPVEFRLGGLIVRDPQSVPGQRNSAHVVLGAGSTAFPVAAEDKTTTSSQSDFIFYPIAEAAGEVRITRSADQISLYFRPLSGGTWQHLRTHSHPEFPSTVQVGPMVYSFQAPPDITVSFDEVIFR